MSVNQITSERRAYTQLKTWLRAVDIPFEDFSSYILVTKKDASKIQVSFGLETEGGERILIDTKKLVNHKIQSSLDFFKGLQEELGYTPKVPVDRGMIPDGKSNDFNLTTMRHFELRKCPNPPAKKLAYYHPVIDIAVNKFYRSNFSLMKRSSIEIEDLLTYAQMWTVNFIGLYELPVRGDDQNKKLLMEFIKQRFLDFKRKLCNNELYALQGLNEKIDGGTSRGNDSSLIQQASLFDYYKHQNESNDTFKALDKTEAVKLLNERLLSLEHDEMIQLLLNTSLNVNGDFEVQKEASKWLHTHSLQCFKCADLKLPTVGGGDLAEYGNRPITDQLGIVYNNPRDAARKLDLYSSNIRSVLKGDYSQTGGYTFKYVSQNKCEVDPEIPVELN